jgi:Phosphotransferase enzyme family
VTDSVSGPPEAAAVLTALAVAAEHGLRCDEPVVLRHLTNTLVHLGPEPVVARVPVTLSRLRGPGWERRVVELASFLAAEGAPVVPPSRLVPPGPHVRDGLHVSFWAHVDHDPDRFDAAEAGRSLRALHRTLATATVPLPGFERLDELALVIEGLPASPHVDAVRAAHARLHETSLPRRPLHGDAHFGNVLWTRGGPLWTDLENACLGPVEYDLAALAWRGMDGTAEALAAYGDHDGEVLERVTPYLALFLAAWTLDLAERHDPVRPFAEERADRVRAWLENA